MKWQKLQTVYSYHPKIIANSVQHIILFTLILNEVAEIALLGPLRAQPDICSENGRKPGKVILDDKTLLFCIST